MIYYKGNLLECNDVEKFVDIGRHYSTKGWYFTPIFENRIRGLNNFREIIVNIRKYNYSDKEANINNEYLINIFKEAEIKIDFKNIGKYISAEDINNSPEIIFTKVIDEEGRVFAREIQTGTIFPLLDNSVFDTDYTLSKWNTESNRYENDCYTLRMNLLLNPNTPLVHAECVVGNVRIANHNEVEEYLGYFDEKSDYYGEGDLEEDDIIHESKRNVFNSEIHEREDKDYSLSEINKICEEIVYYLNYLKQIDKGEGDVHSIYYNHLLKNYGNKDLNAPITVDDFKRLLSKIKFLSLFNFNQVPEGVYTTLNTISINSSERMKGNKNGFEFPIEKLDKLYELFVENKELLSLPYQQAVIGQFASCYISKVQEFDLSEEDLINTHFFELTYSIMNRLGYYNLPEVNDDSDLVNIIKLSKKQK